MNRGKAVARQLIPASIWEQLRAARLRMVLRGYRRRTVRHNFAGHELTLLLADPLAEGWYDHDVPELPEMALLSQSKLQAGARVFNLGAHQGVNSLILARKVGPMGGVVAVEAIGHNAEIAQKNADLNAASQITVVHAAVADIPGSVRFTRTLTGHTATGKEPHVTDVVRAVSIDSLTEEFGTPDVIYVDIEGSECDALAGASLTMNRRPDWFIEMHVGSGMQRYGCCPDTIVRQLRKLRYELFITEHDFEKYQPLREGDSIPGARFFLVALSSDSGGAIS